jgi:hypothetical protein
LEVIAIFIFFAGHAPLLFGLIYVQRGSEKDFSNVSGFYGPGAVLAFLLITITTLFSYIVDELDVAGSIATFVYAITAAADAILHIFRGQRDAQYDAAVIVCIYTTILVAFCLYISGNDGQRSFQPHPRRWIFSLLFTICAIPMIIDDFISCFSLLGLSKAIPILGAAIYFSEPDSCDPILGSFFATAIGWIPILFFLPSWGPLKAYIRCSIHDTEDLRIRFAIPPSAAKLGDLDQAAALGSAIIGVVYSFGLWRWILRQLIRWYRMAGTWLLSTWGGQHRRKGSEEALPLREFHGT